MNNKEFSFLDDIAAELMLQIATDRNNGTYIIDNGLGFRNLDYKIARLQGGNLIIVGGRPSMGKTSFALNIASNMAISKKKNIVFFSAELSKEMIVSRIISTRAKVDADHIRTGQLSDDEWNRLCKSVEEIGNSRLIVDDTPGITIEDIYNKCLPLKELKSVDMIIVDYLQLVSTIQKTEIRQQEVEYIIRKLKLLAKEINVPVLVISQLSRTIEQRHDKHPMLADFRETNAIEEAADTIIFIYRDDYYNKDSKYKGLAEIMVAKNRTGECGSVYLECDPKTCEFRDHDGIVPSKVG